MKKTKLNKAEQKQIFVQEDEDRAGKVNLPAQKKALVDKYNSVFYFVIVLGSPFNLGPES